MLLLAMRCVPIIGPSLAAIKDQVARAVLVADFLEWRLDLFAPCSIAELEPLRQSLPCPVIFTGKNLAELKPDFQEGQDIISYHNFVETPDLEPVLHKLQQHPARYYKIACQARSTLDALRMVSFTRQHENVVGLCMGERGRLSRYFTRPWTYVALDEEHRTASGQLTLEDPYNSGPLYGIMKGPETESLSDKTHNRFLQALGIEALYLPLVLEKQELQQFFIYARELGFKGLSVTMPLKEAVVPYLDRLDQEAEAVGAVNTIVFEGDELVGYNTDASAALEALGGSVSGKRLAILGQGGAAKALAYAARKAGAEVSLAYRREPPPYDILVNATPVSPAITHHPGALVMDMRPLLDTPFLASAQAAGCTTIPGYKMFIKQALAQFALWDLIALHK